MPQKKVHFRGWLSANQLLIQPSAKNTVDILLRQMDLWYRSAPGSFLLDAERKEIDKYLPQYFGQHFLQIGGASEIAMSMESPIAHCVRLSSESATVFRGPSVQGEFHAMPFLPESVDVILLQHLLEFVAKPEIILEQINTILAPEGHVLILGFNPYSLWGLYKIFSRKKTLPWRGRFRASASICHWLKKHDYEIEAQNYIFYRPPIANAKQLKKLLALEIMGRLLWTNCGAVYLIVAKKKERALIPLKPILQPVAAR